MTSYIEIVTVLNLRQSMTQEMRNFLNHVGVDTLIRTRNQMIFQRETALISASRVAVTSPLLNDVQNDVIWHLLRTDVNPGAVTGDEPSVTGYA